MPRKTKKQKIRSSLRTQPETTVATQNRAPQSPVYSFSASQSSSHIAPKTDSGDQILSYIKKDLLKTIVLSAFAIGVIMFLAFRPA